MKHLHGQNRYTLGFLLQSEAGHVREDREPRGIVPELGRDSLGLPYSLLPARHSPGDAPEG